MIVSYQIDAPFQQAMQVVEEVRTETGLEPVGLCRDYIRLMDYDRAHAAAVVRGEMNEEEYFRLHRK